MEKETEYKTNKNVNQGINVRRFRQLLDMKQDTLAEQLGISQQMISYVEQQKTVAKELLVRIAAALKVPVEIIEGLDDNPMSVILENNTFDENNTFENGSTSQTLVGSCDDSNLGNINGQQINPLDKILEMSKEISTLYERMFALEKEKNALLEQMLKEKKG